MAKRLLIVYHSQSGRTQQLAEALMRGVSREPLVMGEMRRAKNAASKHLLACDAVIFGTPENFGYMSGALKDFFDRTYDELRPKQLNLPFALFVSASNDGRGAVREVERILKGYPMRKIAEPVIARGALTDEHLRAYEELGETVASGMALGIF